MVTNRDQLIISNILVLTTLISQFNNFSFFQILIIVSVFGIIGSVGAILIELNFHRINRFAKYFINTLWIGIFITLYMIYIVFTNEIFELLPIYNKTVLVGVFSFFSTLISFAFQHVFFIVSSISIVRLKTKN